MNFSKNDLIWSIIGKKGFCSYKFKSVKQNFCASEFNVTGLCSKQSCPLSNSNYATVIEKNGEIYLYVRDKANSRYPDKLWKRFLLSRNFIKSLQELDLILNLWPKFLVHKTKQKLTKLRQKLLREKLNELKRNSVLISKKKNLTYKLKESKLISKIKFESLVEKELLHRFNLGIYGKLYPLNFIQKWRNGLFNTSYSTILKKKEGLTSHTSKVKTFVSIND